MNKKKVAVVVAAGIAAMSMAIILPVTVLAQSTPEGAGNFVQALAEKLGISEEKVQTAVDQIRTEHKAEMQQKRAQEITNALSAGKITQRQADILNALPDARSTVDRAPGEFRREIREAGKGERLEKAKELASVHRQEILDALNAKGLNVTEEELKSAQTALHAAIAE